MWNRKEQAPADDTPRIIENKEVTPCGMEVEYKLDLKSGIVTENNIAHKGTGKKTKHCSRCQWRTICQPTPVRVEDITKEIAGIQTYINELRNDARMSEVKSKIQIHYDEIQKHYNEIILLFDEAKAIRENDFIEIQSLINQMKEHLQMVPENEL